ncbi:YgfZ/GcvT domain-containing protein [Alkalilimnicola sp. S0819]|uniref:CAF17-like 4Fe-4S cluster assembly/insertion protein YgfZ n=1 Tax=Alkalilimnicola sp. S0819 TaxID=2613922 RepID=UPI001261A234|nr:folate-binding protein YgfZ [Alkalilimnicola sp. S0819]KAB7627544.1 folate-binding protein YgfZ [Alkalilimnicola sp. S0819]MPQ15699.1 folate-binding protein [Alkalilimnicola sp. S0819]
MGWQEIFATAPELQTAPAAAEGNSPAIAALPGFGVLGVSGADAAGFLHNQLSNDAENLGPDESRLAAYCSPKGRVIAVVLLYREGEDFRLLAPVDLLDTLRKRLTMFVLRSKVSITDLSAERLVWGLGGRGLAETLDAVGLGAPDTGKTVGHEDGTSLLRLPGETARYLLISTPDAATRRLTALRAQFLPQSAEGWALGDIRAGLPWVLDATRETWVPQTLNLDLIGGINFRKGCYPGQEVVARMKYLGKLKRRCYRISLSGSEAPAPGSEVRDGDEKLVGELVNVAADGAGGYEALAALRMDALDKPLSCEGHPVTLRDLPYEISNETA